MSLSDSVLGIVCRNIFSNNKSFSMHFLFSHILEQNLIISN